MDGSRPSKRAKLSFFRPFAPSGAVSASKSSGLLDDEYLAKMTLDFLDSDESFFPSDVEEPGPIVIGKKVQRALGRKDILEEALRNAVYTDLMENHEIQFPASSRHWKSEMRLRRKLNRDYRYKEADLALLLNEFYEQINDDGGGNGPGANEATNVLVLERILFGLNVTTTSLPDMTVLRGESLIFGEFKNSAKYATETAAKQCVLYLYALLYFFRVRLGRPVKAVFGFLVCGCGCFNDMSYSVGFVRLSVPDKLGSSMVPQVYVQYCGTDDYSGIQSLVHFLKRGKVFDHDTTYKVVEPSRRIPALLTLPEALWESEFLVTNGTASMVFKGNADAIQGLIDQFDPGDSIFYPGAFLSSVGELFSQLSDRQTRDFYLKIRLKDTTLQEFPSEVIGVLKKRAKDCYREMYPVTPVGDARFGIFLMNDCGTVLHESEKFAQLNFAQFLVLYRDFWAQTINMSNFFLHGDALPHNIVYKEDAKKLVLIDLDEGINGKKAPKRVIQEGSGLQYCYLRYPNFYRLWSNRTVYTQLQLVASFLLIVPLFEGTSEGEKLTLLRDRAATADSFLRRRNAEEPDRAKQVDTHESVKQVITLMEGILTSVAS